MPVLLLPILLAPLCTTAWAEEKTGTELTIVTGQHCVTASRVQRRAYPFGVGNVLEIEQPMAGQKYQMRSERGIVPVPVPVQRLYPETALPLA